MIILRKYSQLSSAATRAAKINPPCRVVGFGEYQVRGSRGNWYTVRCEKKPNGDKLVWCSCEEGKPRRAGVPCYHMVPAVGCHVILAIAQRSVIIAYDSK